MMDCESARILLGPWLDGELGDAQAEQVRAHLNECPLCLQEETQWERLQASLKTSLEVRASQIPFDPFWKGVERRILEKVPWREQLRDGIRSLLYPRRLAWVVPVMVIFLLGIFSLGQFLPGWRSGSSRRNLTAVDSIDAHGLNLGLFREPDTKTLVIWLFENQEEEDESSEETT